MQHGLKSLIIDIEEFLFHNCGVKVKDVIRRINISVFNSRYETSGYNHVHREINLNVKDYDEFMDDNDLLRVFREMYFDRFNFEVNFKTLYLFICLHEIGHAYDDIIRNRDMMANAFNSRKRYENDYKRYKAYRETPLERSADNFALHIIQKYYDSICEEILCIR